MNVIKNENRIVTLTSVNSDLSWRNQLSALLGLKNPKDASHKIVDSEELDVDEDVELLIEGNLPSFQFKYGKKQPVRELIESVTKVIPPQAKAVAQGAQIAIEAAAAVANNIGGGEADNTEATSNVASTSAVFNPWTQSAPAWDAKTEALKFSYTFNFKLGQSGLWNAKQEVFLPILNLMAPVLPRFVGSWFTEGPIPGQSELLVDSILNIFHSRSDDAGLGDALSSLVTNAFRAFAYDIQFGKTVKLYNCLIDEAKPTFSSDTDEDGYPIAGSIELHFTTTAPYGLSSTENAKAVKFGVGI